MKETSETRDDGFQGTTFSSKKLTDPSLFSNSDITPDPIITTMSDRNEKHIQSKQWIFILEHNTPYFLLCSNNSHNSNWMDMCQMYYQKKRVSRKSYE